MAKITIFSTKGSSKRVHETTVTTWGDLKAELSEHYDFSNLQATENVNRTDLSAPTAKLPGGDFTLFLRPVRTKSGSEDLSFSEAREVIKEDKDLQEYIKETYGRNYTILPTATLNEAIRNMYDNETEVEEEDYDEEDYDIEEENNLEEESDILKRDIDSLIEKLENFKNRIESLFPSESIEIDAELEALQREAREIFGDI